MTTADTSFTSEELSSKAEQNSGEFCSETERISEAIDDPSMMGTGDNNMLHSVKQGMQGAWIRNIMSLGGDD